MAQKGERKRLQNNKQRIQTLTIWMICGIVLYILVRLVLRKATASSWHYFGLINVVACQLGAFWFVKKAAAPSYSSSGELLSGGADLNVGGVTEYLQDVIYAGSIVLILTCISDWLWFLSLLIPVYGAYLLYVGLAKPYMEATKNAKMMEQQQQQGTKTKSKAKVKTKVYKR